MLKYETLPPQPKALPTRVTSEGSFIRTTLQKLASQNVELQQKAEQRISAVLEEKQKAIAESSSKIEELQIQLNAEIEIGDELRKQINDLEQERNNFDQTFNQFVSEHDERLSDIRDLQNKLDIASYEKEELEIRLLDHEVRSKHESENADQAPSEIEQIFCLHWPEVDFLRGSLEILAKEIDDYDQVIRKLREIIILNQQGDKVKGMQNWRELHFSTGRDDDGRIYFLTPNKTENNKYHILISYKNLQDSDFRYLAKH